MDLPKEYNLSILSRSNLFELMSMNPKRLSIRHTAEAIRQTTTGHLALLAVLFLPFFAISQDGTLAGKNVLFTYGGWEGHDPEGCVAFLQPWLESEGAHVQVYNSLAPYADEALMDSIDLIIQVWTQGAITKPQLKGLLKVVRNGCGFVGWHGGVGDAFRKETAYQFMLGGQWVAHPGGKIDYVVRITDPVDPVTHGLTDFLLTGTEQYYMHVDPNVKVLATTTFNGAHSTWIDGCTMPVVWKKQFGKGRIFYMSIGHFVNDLRNPNVSTMLKRGFRWAAQSKYASIEPWKQPIYPASSKWEYLLDKDLSKWYVYLGVPHETTQVPGYADSDRAANIPLGKNVDPLQVFSMDSVGGEWMLHITGEIYGAVTTQASYENYHLQWKFKWGEKKWPPRLEKEMDSGILYHCQGPDAASHHCWKSSVECQVEAGDCGEFWSLAGSYADIPAVLTASTAYRFDPGGTLHAFSPKKYGGVGGNCHESHDAEREMGEWNTMDLYCIGDQAIHVVNGQVVMALQNIRTREGDIETPLTAGQIQIQSEAAEIWYKGIRIRPIEAFPTSLKTAAGLP